MTAANGDMTRLTSGINVTPMIDVLLVLLIIFMVIVPAVPRGEAALAPRSLRGNPDNDAVVLEVLKGADNAIEYRINQQHVTQGELPSRLAAIYAKRAQRVLFLKGDDQLSFTQIAEVVDMSHAVGVDQIGLMTPKVLAGQ